MAFFVLRKKFEIDREPSHRQLKEKAFFLSHSKTISSSSSQRTRVVMERVRPLKFIFFSSPFETFLERRMPAFYKKVHRKASVTMMKIVTTTSKMKKKLLEKFLLKLKLDDEFRSNRPAPNGNGEISVDNLRRSKLAKLLQTEEYRTKVIQNHDESFKSIIDPFSLDCF